MTSFLDPQTPPNRALRRATSRGVTRFELMLVVGALSLLGLGGAWLNLGHAAHNPEATARERGQALLNAATDWKREHSGPGCPSITQLKRESRLNSAARTEDPWGERFRLRCTDQEVQVWSAGGDRQFLTPDDITLAAQPTS